MIVASGGSRMGRLLLTVCALVGLAVPAAAQSRETGFLDRSIEVGGTTSRYQVYVPSAYDPARRWPVILFLHGAGERGSDGVIQTEVGLGSAIRRFVDRYPAIVVFPQTPTRGSWTGPAGDVAMAALDRTLGEFSTDDRRVYLTGLSMGGNGSWYLAWRHPERWAGVVVVCGFLGIGQFPSFLPADTADPAAAVAGKIRHLPIWVFHGDADKTVPVTASREVVAALEKAGATVKYTELPGVGHNAWDPAYRDPELPVWLFGLSR
jgi:predicted peptidase